MHKQLEEICSRVDSDLLAGVKPDDIFTGYTQRLPTQYQDFSREYTALVSAHRSEAQKLRDEAEERGMGVKKYGYHLALGLIVGCIPPGGIEEKVIAAAAVSTIVEIFDLITDKSLNLGYVLAGAIGGAVYQFDYKSIVAGASIGLGVSLVRFMQKRNKRNKELEIDFQL